MPIPIGGLSPRATSSDPAQLLLECHDRIRQHMRGALALCKAPAADEAAIAATARGLIRDITIALTLHAQDEDESVGPRLAATALSPSFDRAVADMTLQHADIDRVLERLLPAWETLAGHPDQLETIRESLTVDTVKLVALWDVHLDLEECVVFPLIGERLDEATRDTIVAEMRRRRVPKSA
jgi:hemerythrin-like domain-containing protein